MSAAAFDAALQLAQGARFLLSEALTVFERTKTGRTAGGSSSMHWSERVARQRLAEVMGRMDGPREPLVRLLTD